MRAASVGARTKLKGRPMQKIVEKPERPKPQPRRTKLVLVPILFFGGLAALFAYALQTADPSKLPSVLIGKPAPSLVLPALPGLVRDGQPIPGFGPADLNRGDVTVVNVWASWCVPCVQEHPLLTDLKRLTGVRLLGINNKDPEPGGLRFLTRLGNPFDAVGVDANGRTAIEWGVYGVPETFVVDGRGLITHKHVGPITPEIMTRILVPAIDAAKAKPKL